MQLLINQPRFSPLKDMQQFTENMFNHIIDFQEKKQLAWDESAPFPQRLENLPLHYFIFSNYDRDPATQGPTLAHYYPLKKEMHKLAHYLHCAGCIEVIDYYPGNGLLGSLLAREARLPAKGLAFNNKKPSQIENFYDSNCYQMFPQATTIAPGDKSAYFVSWTPSGSNPVAELLAQKARLIIFVGSNHVNPQTGERQVGVDNMFDGLQDSYQLWDSWEIVRAENLLHKIWPDMTPNIEERRQVHVFANNQIAANKQDYVDLEQNQQAANVYCWESELQMAELAAEAMESLKHLPFAR